jgi:hypothetical protein
MWSPSRIIASTYLTVRGDISDGSLNRDEIGIIAEKLFASSLGQAFMLTKVKTAKLQSNGI